MISSVSRLQDIYNKAIDLPLARREEAVRKLCAAEPSLADEVLDLLRANEAHPTCFLDRPVAMVDYTFTQDSDYRSLDSVDVGRAATHLPFEIVRKIGEGGHGVVFLGRQADPSRPVAIKVLRCGAGESLLERFKHEYRTMAQLQHPGIVHIISSGFTDYLGPYFAMEYVEGPRITDFVSSNHLQYENRLNLFLQVGDIVQFAHRKGVLHRDLKPANILIAAASGTVQPKIIDFGIAKLLVDHEQKDLTSTTGIGVGTAAYCAPEQLQGSPEAADARSDVFALGVILHEMISGGLPWHPARPVSSSIGDQVAWSRQRKAARLSDSLSRLDQRASRGAHPLRQCLPRVKAELDWIIAKAIQPDPKERYASVQALADDVRRHLHGENVVARPPSRSYRLRKFVKRHAGAMLTASLLAIALLASTVVSAGFGLAAKEQAQQSAKSHYQAALNSAWSSILVGDAGRADAALETAPLPLRGWEWDYLRAEADHSVVLLDGLGRYPVAFDLQTEAGLAAVGKQNGELQIWNIHTGAQLGLLSGQPVRLVRFSADASKVVVARSRTLQCVDVLSMDTVWSIPLTYNPECLALDADDIVVGLSDGSVASWGIADGSQSWSTPPGPDSIIDVAFLDEGNLAVMLGSGLLIALDPGDGTERSRRNMCEMEVARADIAPQVGRVALLTTDGLVSLYDLEDGRRVDYWPHDSGNCTAISVTSPSQVAVGGYAKSIRVFSPGTRLPLSLLGHHKAVRFMLSISGQPRLYSLSDDGTLRAWQFEDQPGPEAGILATAKTCGAVEASFADPHRVAALLDGQAQMLFLDGRTAAIPLADGVSVLSFSADGKSLALGLQDGTALSCDESGDCVRAEGTGHPAAISAIAITRTGLVMTGTVLPRDPIRVWHTGASAKQELILEAPELSVVELAVSPNDDYLAAGAFVGGVVVWELGGGTRVPLDVVDEIPSTVAFLDEDHLAAGFDSGRMAVWRISTGKRIADWQAHEDWVYAIEPMPRYNRIVTSSRDGSLRFWEMGFRDRGAGSLGAGDMADLAQILAISSDMSPGYAAPIHDLAASADGEALLGACVNGDLRIYRR